MRRTEYIMWTIIFLLIIASMVSGLIYLVSRVYKTDFIEKTSKGKKSLRILISILLVIAVFAAVWFAMGNMNAIVCLIHLVVFWILSDLLLLIIKKKRKKSFKRYYGGALAALITVAYLGTGYFMAHHVWRTDYTVETNKVAGNIRIIQFADSHVGTTFNGQEFETYVKKMQEENPDVVLITGDFVDDDTSKEDMIAACKALGTLKTTYGIYYSFGNHDKGYYGPQYRGYSGQDLIKELTKNNVKVLQDESVLIDNRFYIIGRQDRFEEQYSSGRAGIIDLVKDLDKDKYMIVMDHQPHDYKDEADAKVDLVLSGHTHGGQLFPINFIGELIKENDRTYGYEKRQSTDFIVTSGISDWAIDFKTGCKSEYVVIDVKGK